jgi:predicted  nucleic acid-binding Zn-ribbon protein
VDERTRLKAEGRALVQDREPALQAITPENQKVYMTLKPRKNNQPVAQLVNQSCSFCRVQQDLAVINEARKGQHLAYCASCGRILVYKSA